ncbi:MAG: hypothetical protein IKZ46_06405 [Victivallales bacterium]|nr:hypothetical protein [Victivallales bacterium]
MTTKERDEYIASQLNAGVSLSDVQTKLAQEYGVKMTYFELRMLAMGLAVDWEKQDKPKPAATPAPVVAVAPQEATANDGTVADDNAFDTEPEAEDVEPEADDDEEEEAADDEEAAEGETKIVLDETPHPGAALSGTAVFASGASGKWALSRNGRLGFEPDEGSAEPDENDWQLFQVELQKTIQSIGGEEDENTTVVDVDKIVRPGVQLSGSVTFASGAKGTWYIGQRGLGVEPAEGSSKPTQKDVILFQRKLQEVLQKQGY